MTTDTTQRALRIRPALIIVAVQAMVMIGAPLVSSEGAVISLATGAIAAVLTLVWWLLFSRAPWLERLVALALIAVTILALKPLVHESIAGAGRGFLLYPLALPWLTLGLVVWAALTARRSASVRWVAAVVVMVIAAVPFTAIRTLGIKSGGSEFQWRWTPSAEERLLASADPEPPPVSAPERAATPQKPAEHAKPVAPVAPVEPVEPVEPVKPVWSGFRGPKRDGVVHGVRINADWSITPPTEMWRRPVGPGWSSFAVHGDLIYTQEQRGGEEMVSCYRLSTGEPVWRHRDSARFWESNGGAGPRGTPTIHHDRIYAFGATGLLNALDAKTGARIWSRDVAADTGRAVPEWGFASSPLVVGDVVIVAAAGTLAGYDINTGDPRWKGPSYGGSYSSPHLVTSGGVDQVVLLGGPGAISLDPATGTQLWLHRWEPGPIVQPAVTDDGDIIVNTISMTGGEGTRRLHVTPGPGEWTVEERWTSRGLKPNFNDFVLHKGHAFGFDNNILSSINLADGSRNWKGGRYGNGQLILLADQDLLLVTSEDGEVALVSATTDGYREVAKFTALHAKTWNHPVVVGNVLLVRNGEEMAAFKLPMADGATSR